MISSKALDLILDAEGCDLKPNWPGGASGVTYGYGFDLGYNTKDQIQKDWGSLVNGNVLAFMLSCSGIKGEAAKRLINPTTKTLRITQEAAEQVFQLKTIPRFYNIAMGAFPGLEHCPLDTIGAVVSLVFNRGASMGVEGQASWDTRREMRELRAAIQVQDLQGAADAIRRMKRLWVGKGLDGLITRRENEAQLIEASIL